MIDILRTGPCRSPSLREIELSDAVLILGEDVTNVAPRMALSLRQSVRQQPMQIADKIAHSRLGRSRRAGGAAGCERTAVYRQPGGNPSG